MAWCMHRVCASRFSTIWSLSRVLPQFYSRLNVDAMEEFTSQLIQKKIEKWDQQKRKSETLLENSVGKCEPKGVVPDIGALSTDQLQTLFQNHIENEDAESVVNLTKSCIEHNQSLPVSSLFNILSFCSQKGEKKTIEHLQKMCKVHHPDIISENSNFRDFLAEAVWMKGDVLKALEIFEEVYRENAYLRRRIRLMLKYLTVNLVATGSEAALSKMISFSERILLDFNDFIPLTCVWQNCFLSEWFTDQKIALELLEKHGGLCKAVINRIPYVVFVSLKCHRTEVIYRLLEILLQYRMRTQYSNVLGSLLQYQFRHCDWDSCSEIINWAVTNDVPLPQNDIIERINQILNQKLKTPLAPLERRPGAPTKCDFKF